MNKSTPTSGISCSASHPQGRSSAPVNKAVYTVAMTFSKPSIKTPFRKDLSHRRQLELIHQYRSEVRVKANWDEWLKTWSSQDCHLKFLLALLGEAKRVAADIGHPETARERVIVAMATHVVDEMKDPEDDHYVELLSEIASLGLFRLTKAAIKEVTVRNSAALKPLATPLVGAIVVIPETSTINAVAATLEQYTDASAETALTMSVVSHMVDIVPSTHPSDALDGATMTGASVTSTGTA